MRNKYRPWVSTIYCALLAVIVVVTKLVGGAFGVKGDSIDGVFFLFLPMCFFFISDYLIELRQQNEALRERLDAIEARTGSENV